MSITQKFLGNATRVGDLVRANPHKPSLWVGHTLTFREMHAGEQLALPQHWNVHSRSDGSGTSGLGNCIPVHAAPSFFEPRRREEPHAWHHPQHHAQHARHAQHHRGVRGTGDAPSFEVAPRAQGAVHEPILTVSGPSSKVPCCARCGQTGGSCAGEQNTIANPCSQPQASPSIPGSTSFPVGFGQGPITTQVPAVAVVSSWAVPLAIGLVSAAAGFGLAYWIAGKD